MVRGSFCRRVTAVSLTDIVVAGGADAPDSFYRIYVGSLDELVVEERGNKLLEFLEQEGIPRNMGRVVIRAFEGSDSPYVIEPRPRP